MNRIWKYKNRRGFRHLNNSKQKIFYLLKSENDIKVHFHLTTTCKGNIDSQKQLQVLNGNSSKSRNTNGECGKNNCSETPINVSRLINDRGEK